MFLCRTVSFIYVLNYLCIYSLVEPHNSVWQNNGKLHISAHFSDDQLSISIKSDLQNSAKPRIKAQFQSMEVLSADKIDQRNFFDNVI